MPGRGGALHARIIINLVCVCLRNLCSKCMVLVICLSILFFIYLFQFLQQYHHYQANLQLFQLKPSQESKPLQSLVMFISQVS